MTAPQYARVAAKLLADATQTHVGGPSPDERVLAIEAAGRALRGRASARRRVRWAFAAAAVLVAGVSLRAVAARFGAPGSGAAPTIVAAAPAITVTGHPLGGEATVVNATSAAPLADGKTLASGSRIVAGAEGRFAVSLSTGTRLVVEEGGDVTVDEEVPRQVFGLHKGALRADVAKLQSGERFLIETSDAEVEVRGTSFRVAIVPPDPSCGSGVTTRVSVREGVVTVRHGSDEARVGPGEQWPSGCSSGAAPQVPTPAAPSAPERRVQAAEVHAPLAPVVVAPRAGSQTSASSLADQNDNFARAIAAKKRGATGEAVADFDQFLAAYPASALAENAEAERMKLLRIVD